VSPRWSVADLQSDRSVNPLARAAIATRAGTASGDAQSDQTGTTDQTTAAAATTSTDSPEKVTDNPASTDKDGKASQSQKTAGDDPDTQTAMTPGMLAALMPQANPVLGTGVSAKTGTGLLTATTGRSPGKAGTGTPGVADATPGDGPATAPSKTGSGHETTASGSRTAGTHTGTDPGANVPSDVDDDPSTGTTADGGSGGSGATTSGTGTDGGASVLKTFAASLTGATPAAVAGQTAGAAMRGTELTPPVGAAQGVLPTGAAGGGGGGAGGSGLSGDGGSNGARSGVATPDGSTSALAGLTGAQAADGQDFASQLTAVRGSRTNLPAGATDQVTVQLQRSIKDGDGSISMQLRPEELGRIDIKLDIDKDGAVNATITADRPQTLELLQRDSHTLERALQDAGLQTNSNSLSFGLRGDGGQGYSQQQQQQQQSGDAGGNGGGSSGQRRGVRGVAAAEDDVTSSAMMVLRRYQAPSGRVDVRI
jgi:hypothetical protein